MSLSRLDSLERHPVMPLCEEEQCTFTLNLKNNQTKGVLLMLIFAALRTRVNSGDGQLNYIHLLGGDTKIHW